MLYSRYHKLDVSYWFYIYNMQRDEPMPLTMKFKNCRVFLVCLPLMNPVLTFGVSGIWQIVVCTPYLVHFKVRVQFANDGMW